MGRGCLDEAIYARGEEAINERLRTFGRPGTALVAGRDTVDFVGYRR